MDGNSTRLVPLCTLLHLQFVTCVHSKYKICFVLCTKSHNLIFAEGSCWSRPALQTAGKDEVGQQAASQPTPNQFVTESSMLNFWYQQVILEHFLLFTYVNVFVWTVMFLISSLFLLKIPLIYRSLACILIIPTKICRAYMYIMLFCWPLSSC